MEKAHQEIERKFLLTALPADLAQQPHYTIEQGYLIATPDGRQVRLRRTERGCTLTFKTADGAVREEREVGISTDQFDVLWPATRGRRLTKTRYLIPWNNYSIELDIYQGSNDGIIVAEVEFRDERQCRDFHKPDWFGPEVTNDARYSNVVLARD